MTRKVLARRLAEAAAPDDQWFPVIIPQEFFGEPIWCTRTMPSLWDAAIARVEGELLAQLTESVPEEFELTPELLTPIEEAIAAVFPMAVENESANSGRLMCLWKRLTRRLFEASESRRERALGELHRLAG